MEPVEIRPGRKSPFKVGQTYRVRCDFKCPRDSFRAGEFLIYNSDAYSRYDCYTGYVFSQLGAQQLRVWDIHDDEQLEIWRDLFEVV